MNRVLIVAKLNPEFRGEVADIFAESDAGSLPVDLGVTERSLYGLGDAYIHLVEFDGDASERMVDAQKAPGFSEISSRLRPFVKPYEPATWRSPDDAMARRFYHWERSSSAR